jgi:predicted phosphodiesterase
MKWLICGDIHGNLPALELLLKKEKGNYDGLICHGDVVNYGPWSNECVQFLAATDHTVLLKGNHESYFLEGVYEGTHPVARAFFDFCYPRFNESALIAGYGEAHRLNHFEVRHTVLDKYIFKDTDLSGTGLNGNFIIGHSHQQYDRQTADFRLVNTGSLGQNRSFINMAEYLVYDDVSGIIELKHFIYDVDILIDAMVAVGYSEFCLDYYRNKRRA